VLVLFLDTATEACVSAVCSVEEPDASSGTVDRAHRVTTLAARAPVDARRHGELLAPQIDEVLAEAGRRPTDLDAVVVGLGPGPFTSLRVGVVTAAAMADALGIRAVGICTLDAIAAGQPNRSEPLVVATDARRREVYWARYAHGRRTAGPGVDRPAVLAEELGPDVRVVGSGAVLYADVFGERSGLTVDPDAPRWPDPAGGVRVALRDPSVGLLGDEPPGPLAPLYLRRPDAVPPGAPKAAARVTEPHAPSPARAR
jgi:tRNA threonylcarbamoyl adenosine modification protein YeaZ